ncbi:MAG TPA: hypothetical protein PKW15_04150, partial [Alphaproteobacteria bacterium]|nr:hypothetical protein [Alphaproteobacteria bacterium]
VNAKKGLFITTNTVQAEDAKKDEHKKEKKEESKADDKKDGDKKDEHAEAEKKPEEAIDPLDVTKQEMRASSELAILQELADRRRAIEQREAAVMEKEALLKASEVQFDAKIKELTDLRNEIKALVDTTKAKEDEETKRLVTIYEKMKPKDAAGILSTLNMSVLLPIARGMKETKLSPILAAMPPDKAKQITDMLARKAQILPQDTPVRAAAEAAAKEALPNLPPPPSE